MQTTTNTLTFRWVPYVLILVFLIFAAIGGYFYLESRTPKIAYVNTIELFNEFELKKELEENITQLKEIRTSILDSLKFEIKNLSRENAAQPLLEQKQKNLIEKQRLFEDEQQKLVQKFDQQILKQMNQYIGDYGKEHNFSIVFGASGEGTIMYAEKSLDITKEVKEYINAQYNNYKRP
jgi:outer membrane protein